MRTTKLQAWGLLWVFSLAAIPGVTRSEPTIKVAMVPTQWSVKGSAAFSMDHQLHAEALVIRKGSATLKNDRFSDGTISFDVKFAGGISGLTFRQRGSTSEVLYFRPGADCPVSDDCIQYMPRDHGIFEWDLYGQYQTRGPIRMGSWNHVKLVVSKRRLNVFVNASRDPVLVVNRMAGVYLTGELELHGAAAFANLVIEPGKIDGLVEEGATAVAKTDPHFLRTWLVAKPFIMPSRMDTSLGENIGIAPSYADMQAQSTSWQHVTTDSDGLLNLTRIDGAAQTGNAIIGVRLKTQIESDRAQVEHVAIGWTREVWVFVNGKEVFAGRNLYGVPGASKNPDGRLALINGSFAMPLSRGKNEIAVVLDDNFGGGMQHFGWGLQMRLDDMAFTHLSSYPAAHAILLPQ